MLKRLAFISATLFLFNRCCNKSACNVNESILPSISVSFANVPQSNSMFKIYTLYQGVAIDSLVQYAYYNGTYIRPYRFINDPTVADKKFVIVRDSKSDTITTVSCEFYPEKTVCSSCWPSGTQYSTVWRPRAFSFVCAGNTYSQNQTLVLEY